MLPRPTLVVMMMRRMRMMMSLGVVQSPPGMAALIAPVHPQVGAVIKIQAFFRANRAREEYRMLGECV